MIEKKIKKILIANRGEIAVRVIRTCKKLGIHSVAVYSDADANAPFVKLADESVHIGASEAKESYLSIPKIISACKSTGADAVHPGYGFLSENPEFALALQKENIEFIGPTIQAINIMGDKIGSRIEMEKANVPVVPGYNGDNQEPMHLLDKAKEIGFPVMIKATAGGGGKGMRRVENEKDFVDALTSAKREALNFFKNDKVLLERYVKSPRHIEFQVFGDKHGNVEHIFERECSIQRRHQKVVEESPAANLDPKLRDKMGEVAVKAAKSIGYLGAGTVEFILGETGEFYFLEMNTRLQVEHPVTEMVTGLDLVELQIRIAEGSPIFFSKDRSKAPVQKGHAIEVRIYAEDPENNFLPSIGKIERVHFPEGEGIRIDTGVEEGTEVSMFYDPMIAKLIVHDSSREKAIRKMQNALGEFALFGPVTNISYLLEIMENSEYQKNNITTHFLDDHLNSNRKPDQEEFIKLVGLFAVVNSLRKKTVSVWDNLSGFQFWQNGNNGLEVRHQLLEIVETLEPFRFSAGGEDYEVRFKRTELETLLAVRAKTNLEAKLSGLKTVDEREIIFQDGSKAYYFRRGNSIFVHYGNRTLKGVCHQKETDSSLNADEKILSPMPGKILKLNVSKGKKIAAGEIVLILEAMKMENAIKAQEDCEVEDVFCKEGDMVMQDTLLVQFVSKS